MEEGWFSQSINLTKIKFEKLGNIVDILQPFNLLDLEVLRSTYIISSICLTFQKSWKLLEHLNIK